MPSLFSAARLKQLSPFALVLAAAVVAASAYLQTLDYPFVSDDKLYVTENTRLAELRLTELWRLFTVPYNPLEFLPLRDLSYRLDMALFGLNATAFRVHNIMLYLLCLPLVYRMTLSLWRYFRPADTADTPWAAAAVTALFALHPAHVEAVVWVSGHKDVLAAIFSLLALWLTVLAKREQGLSTSHAAAALVALLAAMLSKATAVAVAPVIALLWVSFWRDIPSPDRRRFLLLWPLACLLLAACVTLIFAANSAVKIPAYFGVEVITRTLAVLGWLARLAFSPENHHFLYPVFEYPFLPVMVALGGAALAAATISGVMMLRKRSLEGFAMISFVLICMPYIQLIPFKTSSLVSDRFVFLAVWPAMLFAVALAWRLKPIPRTVVLLAIALPFVFQTASRPRDWQSDNTLIGTDMRAFPGYYMPATYMAWDIQVPDWLHQDALSTAQSITDVEVRNFVAKLVQADYAVFVRSEKTGSPREALPVLMELNALLKQPPSHSRWDTPISSIWRGGQDAVESEWQALAERFPDDAPVRYNAGLWLLDIGKYESAVAHLHAATGSQHLPEAIRGTAFKNLGLALMRSGRVAEAEAPLRAALEQAPPDSQAHCLLAEMHRQTGRREEAMGAENNCRNTASNEK